MKGCEFEDLTSFSHLCSALSRPHAQTQQHSKIWEVFPCTEHKFETELEGVKLVTCSFSIYVKKKVVCRDSKFNLSKILPDILIPAKRLLDSKSYGFLIHLLKSLSHSTN